MIKTGKYTLGALKKELKITDYQWKNRQKDLISHLMLYFDLDIIITDNNNYTFIIYQQFDEYQPLPRKGNNEKRKEYYKNITHRILDKEPYNSGSNIARITVRDNQQYEEDVWRTVANYTREIIKEDYDKTGEHIWGFIDMNSPSGYTLLDERQIRYLKDLFTDGCYDKVMAEAHIFSQQNQGIITDRQAKEELAENNQNFFAGVFKAFKEKYGKTPVSIPKWILKEKNKGAWD